MKYIDSFEELVAKLATHKALLIIFVDQKLMTPSDSLLKYFEYSPIARELDGNIYAYRGIEVKMFEIYNIQCYPQVTLIREKITNVLYNFIGCNHEKSWQALTLLAQALGRPRPTRKLKAELRLCPNFHELRLVNERTEPNNRYGLFACNLCNQFSHVVMDKPILRCAACDYDVCNRCSYFESMN